MKIPARLREPGSNETKEWGLEAEPQRDAVAVVVAVAAVAVERGLLDLARAAVDGDLVPVTLVTADGDDVVALRFDDLDLLEAVALELPVDLLIGKAGVFRIAAVVEIHARAAAVPKIEREAEIGCRASGLNGRGSERA